MKKVQYGFIFLCLIFTGCWSFQPSQKDPQPVVTAAFTQTPFSPSATPPPAATSTPAGLSGCSPLSYEPNIKSEGFLVLENRNGKFSPGSFLMDMSSKTLKYVTTSGVGIESSAVSLDRQYFSYIKVQDNPSPGHLPATWLVISSLNGPIQSIPEETAWRVPLGWANQNAVMMGVSMTPADDRLEEPSALLVLYPFENQEKTFINTFENYPAADDVSWGFLVPWWRGRSGTSYNFTLDTAITLFRIPEENGVKKLTYAMWAMPEKRLIRSLEESFTTPLGLNYFPEPIWSPDSSQFLLFVSKKDKQSGFLGGKSGEITEITQIQANQPVFEEGFSWAPNGKMVAAFKHDKNADQKRTGYLALLNMETHTWQDVCLGVQYAGEGYGTSAPYAPIWSPDSNQMVVQDWYEGEKRRLFLIDLQKGIFTMIAENVWPAGWLLPSTKP